MEKEIFIREVKYKGLIRSKCFVAGILFGLVFMWAMYIERSLSAGVFTSCLFILFLIIFFICSREVRWIKVK